MAFRKKKQQEVIETPPVLAQLPPSPIQQLQQETAQEVAQPPTPQPTPSQKEVLQVVAELPTRAIREEVIGDTKVIYQTFGELMQENNQLLKEIKELAREE